MSALTRPTPACAGITAHVPSLAHVPGAHPRMRGDHPNPSIRTRTPLGPAPHARGSPHGLAGPGVASGPTPACAGITKPGRPPHTQPPAHPRMRGDHTGPRPGQRADGGPPPHARGSLAPCCRAVYRERPTPACAGITPRDLGMAINVQAHPRMRGDHCLTAASALAGTGPPPHARGSRVPTRADRRASRPTPACAGITRAPTCASRGALAHPRMRGDHARLATLTRQELGPPPHARGSRRTARPEPGDPGPTPACAGITAAQAQHGRVRPAHPRMRGDHFAAPKHDVRANGPPPHARGSHDAPRLPASLRRPTPACAGITCATRRTPGARRAHPRMRGDHPMPRSRKKAAMGPPPHARGSRR